MGVAPSSSVVLLTPEGTPNNRSAGAIAPVAMGTVRTVVEHEVLG